MLYALAKLLLFRLPPETAHRLTLKVLSRLPLRDRPAPDHLAVTIAGLRFPNPIGLAAGFDKNAEAVAPLLRLGFGFVEAGTVTPHPQPGNPRPRLFRLTRDRAIINQMGFNNVGHDVFVQNMARQRARLSPILEPVRERQPGGIIGGNVGANKASRDPQADYSAGIRRVGPVVDYITINISSPNTPGVRGLQAGEALKSLLDKANDARKQTEDGTARRLPLFVKLAPDLSEDALKNALDLIAAAAMDAVILTNTTTARPDCLKNPHKTRAGGLSGAPLKPASRACLAVAARHLGGAVPLVSVGGIDSAEEIRTRLTMGASLVQLYSSLVYHGPFQLRRWLLSPLLQQP